MIKRYSFLRHPFYHVLENSKQMVGGLEKCIAVFYNERVENIEVICSDKKLTHLNFENTTFLNELRQSKKQANWIKKEQVPFEIGEPVIEQLSFSDEEQSFVLELRFPNVIDKKYDVLYLYFKNNIGNFKLSNIDEAMAVDIKGVIQRLLFNQISLLIHTNKNDSKIHQQIIETINESTLQLTVNLLEKEKLAIARSTYSYLLTNLTRTEEIEFGLSDAAIQRLSDQKLELEEIEQILTRSLEVIINKYNPSNFCEISALDLNLDCKTKSPTLLIKQEKLNNTQQFLDKYEAAAKLLLSKNNKITGLNIGENCHPKVSPAAISDILKKHQNKIVLLLAQHPNRWSTIKHKFKPIANIYERGSSHPSRFGT
jgi:hypothetical protein